MVARPQGAEHSASGFFLCLVYMYVTAAPTAAAATATTTSPGGLLSCSLMRIGFAHFAAAMMWSQWTENKLPGQLSSRAEQESHGRGEL